MREFIISNRIKNNFINNTPGFKWFKLFFQTHPELTIGTAQNISIARVKSCTQEVITNFFDLLNNIYQKYGLKEIPQNIWNADESGFSCDPNKSRIICKKGSKYAKKLISSNEKLSYTVHICCNAVGEYLPPYIIYKGKNLYKNNCLNGPPNTLYNVSKNGWMEEPLFYEWFSKMFVTRVNQLPGEKVLIMDGHSSHISLRIINLAIINNINLICLPSHSTHLLQPLDVGVFKNVKFCWRKFLRNYFLETRFKVVDKSSFPSLIKKLFEKSVNQEHAIRGFYETGIFSINPSNVSEEKLIINNAFAKTSNQICDITSKKAIELPQNSCQQQKYKNDVAVFDDVILGFLKSSTMKQSDIKPNCSLKRKNAEAFIEENIRKQIENDEIQKKQPKKSLQKRESMKKFKKVGENINTEKINNIFKHDKAVQTVQYPTTTLRIHQNQLL